DRLTREIPNAFQPNQYFNPMNPRSHYLTTGPEIWQQTAGRVTHFVAGVGTGGTISGIGKYLKEQNPTVQVIGADPAGSIYTDPDNVRPYKVEGIGEDFWPGTFDRSLVDEFVQVGDRDSLLSARRVTREEGILVGGSGGTAVWAALEIARREDQPETLVVVILPDSGRGYLSKVYNDDWMRENGFLTRFGQATRVGTLIGQQRAGVGVAPELPSVVGVSVEETVEAAIDLLHRYRISQMPVLRQGASAGRIDVHDVVGSIQERTLLDQVFRTPEAVHQQVTSVMDPPFALVNVKEEVERVVPHLSAGSPAVLVEDGGALVGIITRADLLEFVAHRNGEH
ncbi:MAG TPA: pyridoxal-phosphate dependent enzyme, partial [Nitrolancea sp.]|nr:pyridoxal-phosphate dependent enzyme [Nitrolancea sp.]